MDRATAVEQIKTVIAATLGRAPEHLDTDCALQAELNLDSTALLEVLMDLEDSLGFQADIDELTPETLTSIGSLADYVVRVTASA